MGTQPIFARLSISPTGVIHGEITGLAQGAAPPAELVIDGAQAGVYRLDVPSQGLKRLTGKLSPELRERLTEERCWPR